MNPFTKLLGFILNMLFNYCVTDLCVRGYMTCLLDFFFCLFAEVCQRALLECCCECFTDSRSRIPSRR